MPSISLTNPQSNPNTGIAFEITNSKGITSFLIGTCHFADQEMVEKSYFHRIIGQCSALYNEIGACHFITSVHLPEGTHKYQSIKYRYKLDTVITLAANRLNLPIVALDDGIPERELLKEAHIKEIEKLGPKETERLSMLETIKKTSHPHFVALHQSVLKGDIAQLATLRPHVCSIEEERETHWSKILIPELTTGQKPICIAVGALHTVGEGSLTERFQKAGLSVKWIKPSSLA